MLIIDEINRANLPAVLGELIYALEYRGEAVESLYAKDGDRSIIIPENLLIIGTMNTADRSVGHIDYAIRRRFSFVAIPSSSSIIDSENRGEVHKTSLNLYYEIGAIFKNKLSSDFSKEDLMIGHSYFLAKDKEELQMKFDYEIKPLLLEYEKDGILLNASDEIKGLSL